MGDGGADAGQEEQPEAENAGGGAVCCHLTFQTLLQPVRMANPWNLSHPLRVGSAIFRMQVAEGCAIWMAILKHLLDMMVSHVQGDSKVAHNKSVTLNRKTSGELAPMFDWYKAIAPPDSSFYRIILLVGNPY